MVASENEFCKNPTSKNTITTIDSESYGSIGGHKHSLDQDTHLQEKLTPVPAGLRPASQAPPADLFG
jgi:hypothetical protein